MKQSLKVVLTILSVVLCISLYSNFYQYSQNKKVTEEVNSVKKKNKQLDKNIKSVNKKNQTLTNQMDSFKTYQNNEDKSQSELAFDDVANKFLETMFNFEPDTYDERKKEVKGLISTELYEEYFPDDPNFGDANGVSSMLDESTLYTQAKQEENMKGLAVVSFKSKIDDEDWSNLTEMYQLDFDTTTNQLTDVQDLGTSFKASDVY